MDYPTVTYTAKNGETVLLGAITFKAAKACKLAKLVGTEDFNDAFLLESMRAGGTEDPEAILDSLGFFLDIAKLRDCALEANGFKLDPPKAKPGENEPAAPAAA